MTKNILLATAALGVIAFGGQAAAHDLSFRATGSGIAADDTNTINNPNANAADSDMTRYGRSLVGLYLIAQESLGTSLGSGTLNLANPLTAGATLPSGNNFYTIALTNATFGTTMTTANLTGTNCSAVLSSGGTSTSSSVTFLVSSTGSAGCSGFQIVDVPVLPSSAGGTVTVTTNYGTEAGSPIDGGVKTLDAIFAIDAFQPAFNATFTTAGAGVNTTAAIGPVVTGGQTYTTLAGDNNLGRVAIYVDSRANRNLTPGTAVTVGDVVSATVSITGDFTAFDGAAGLTGNPFLINNASASVQASSVTASLATFTSAEGVITQTLASKPNGSRLEVTPDGGQIPASAYAATTAFTLGSGFATQANGAGSLEAIERDGTNFIAPWFGGTQASSVGVIRLSSTGAASGSVSVQLINGIVRNSGGTNVTLADTMSCPVGVVPADGDLVIDSATLSGCFGAFVRGDVLVTVEGAPAGLTAKSRSSSNGVTYETSLGRYSGGLFNDASTSPTAPVVPAS